MRVKKVLRGLLGLERSVVICRWDLSENEDGSRPRLSVWVRPRTRRRGRCGRCGCVASWYDRGGGERRWRHVDVGYATCDLIADAPRVDCPTHGPTVGQVPWARHDSAFSGDFEDMVVWEAIAACKQAAADRYGISWRAVNNACVRVATEALERVDLLEGLVAIAIDEVKYKKGQRYLTVVCDHLTGRVVWAAKGRSKDTVETFFAALGEQRAARLGFVTCDGAEWIRTVVAARAPDAIICLDPFHIISWATDALDEVRRDLWQQLRKLPDPSYAHAFKGSRWALLKNPADLTERQADQLARIRRTRGGIWRAYEMKEQFRAIFTAGLEPADAIAQLDRWTTRALRSRLPSFVKAARTIRDRRGIIINAIEQGISNGRVEGLNTKVRLIIRRGYGFHSAQAALALVMLSCGPINLTLPNEHQTAQAAA